jgi:hypothetical protein
MSRKKSKYKPKGVRLDNLQWVMAGIQPFAKADESATVQIKNHDALNNMRLGKATKHDLDLMISAFNVMEGLLRIGYGLEFTLEIRAAQDALYAVASRGGNFVMRAAELNEINRGMEIHDAQLEACTVQDLEKAMDIVVECVAHKRARVIKRKETTSVK